MKDIKVFIKEDKGDALWLIIERKGHDGVAHPILKDEVKAIAFACLGYLNKLLVKKEPK